MYSQEMLLPCSSPWQKQETHTLLTSGCFINFPTMLAISWRLDVSFCPKMRINAPRHCAAPANKSREKLALRKSYQRKKRSTLYNPTDGGIELKAFKDVLKRAGVFLCRISRRVSSVKLCLKSSTPQPMTIFNDLQAAFATCPHPAHLYMLQDLSSCPQSQTAILGSR